MMDRLQRSSAARPRAMLFLTCVTAVMLAGCGEQKSAPVARSVMPSSVGGTTQPAAPSVNGAAMQNPQQPWIGSKPPPGSAMPPGGPKIPQK